MQKDNLKSGKRRQKIKGENVTSKYTKSEKSKPQLIEDNEKENNKPVSTRSLIAANFSNTEQ